MAVNPFELLGQVMRKRATETERLVTGIAQEAARHGAEHVTDETPADVGTARSNWIASINQPNAGTIPAYAPGSHLGRFETANKGAARAQQDNEIKKFDSANDSSIHITNNLDYIAMLNDTDHSAQADPGWFDRAVPVMQAAIRGKWKLKAD